MEGQQCPESLVQSVPPIVVKEASLPMDILCLFPEYSLSDEHVFKITSKSGASSILPNPNVVVSACVPKPIAVRAEEQEPLRASTSLVKVWVRLNGLSFERLHGSIILGMAKELGHPIRIDVDAQDRGFEHYVRVLVEVDLAKPMKEKVMLERPGESSWIWVTYENLPDYCSFCKVIGHILCSCREYWMCEDGNTSEAGRNLSIVRREKRKADHADSGEGGGPVNGRSRKRPALRQQEAEFQGQWSSKCSASKDDKSLIAKAYSLQFDPQDDLPGLCALGVQACPDRASFVKEVRWHCPLPGWIKCNTDGSSRGSPGVSTAAGVFRNSEGFVRGCFAAKLDIGNTTNEAELSAALSGVEIAFGKGWKRLWLETDSSYVVSLFQDRRQGVVPLKFSNRWVQVLEMIDSMEFIVSHIFREGNTVADALSKIHQDKWWCGAPDFIMRYVERDLSLRPYFRYSRH